MAACFAADYQSEFPAHPDRAFRGRAQMRENWTQLLGAVPDLRAALLRCTVEGETVWAEWEWSGTHHGGAPFLVRGVTIQGVPDDTITWVRLYMEPVRETGPGIPDVLPPAAPPAPAAPVVGPR
jgi:hypothetical protein